MSSAVDVFWAPFLATLDSWFGTLGRDEFCKRLSDFGSTKGSLSFTVLASDQIYATERRYQHALSTQIDKVKGPVRDLAYLATDGVSIDQSHQSWDRLRPYHLHLLRNSPSLDVVPTPGHISGLQSITTNLTAGSIEELFHIPLVALAGWGEQLSDEDEGIQERRHVPCDNLLGSATHGLLAPDVYSPTHDLHTWLSQVTDTTALATDPYTDNYIRLLLHKICLFQKAQNLGLLGMDTTGRRRLSRIPLRWQLDGNDRPSFRRDDIQAWSHDLAARGSQAMSSHTQADCILGCMGSIEPKDQWLAYDIRPRHRSVWLYTWSFSDLDKREVLIDLFKPLLQNLPLIDPPAQTVSFDADRWRFYTSIPTNIIPESTVSFADTGPLAISLIHQLALGRVDEPITAPSLFSIVATDRASIAGYRLEHLDWLIKDKEQTEGLYARLSEGQIFPV